MARMARMLLAPLLVVAFASPLALADDQGDCQDKWDDSDASDYCTATVTWWSSGERCRIVGSCSISVDVDNTQTTFTPNLNHTKSKENTGKMDICFQVGSSVIAGVWAGCPTGQVDSSDATTDGLTTTSN